MIQYGYDGTFQMEQLQRELVEAGVPPSHINGSGYQGPGTPALHVDIFYDNALNPLQKAQLDGVVANHVPEGPRVPRPLHAIHSDVQALTAGQTTTTWNDLSSGSPRKYLTDYGTNAAAIFAMHWSVFASGATGAALRAAQNEIITMYAQDNPRYLVAPPWDTTINVPGDMPA